jgi:thiamine kinase-like enzyme
LADGKAHGIKMPYDRYEKMMAEKAVYLEDIKEPALVDFDLWPGNIFVKEVSGEYVIEGIIDFERAYWGDPMADFPPALMILKNLRQEPEFWNTYCEKANLNHELTKEDDIRQKLYSLYIWTIMTLETFRYDFLYGRLQQAFSRKYALKYLKELEQS